MSNRNRIGYLTYSACERMLKNNEQMSLGYQTWLRKNVIGEQHVFQVVHFRTPIVTYYPNGAVIVDCAGFRTRTTLDRVKDVTAANIYQKNYVWRWGSVFYFDGINVGVPRDERESVLQASAKGDEVALLALADMDKESA